MTILNKKIWFKVNKKPVGMGRAVELKEPYDKEKRQTKIVKVGKESRIGTYNYNVYVRRKGM